MQLRPKGASLTILAALLALTATFLIWSMRRGRANAAIAPIDSQTVPPSDPAPLTSSALAEQVMLPDSQAPSSATGTEESAAASQTLTPNSPAQSQTGSAATGSAIDAAQSRRITARDQFGQGVADVELVFQRRGMVSAGPRKIETQRTDAAGVTRAWLSAGDWSVELAHPFPFLRGGVPVSPPEDVCVRTERMRIGDEEEILVTLDRGLRISGCVVDAAGSPIAGAWVSAKKADARSDVATKADAEGRFELTPLAFGEYEVKATGNYTPGFHADSMPVRAIPGDQGVRLVMPVGFEIEVHVIAQEGVIRDATGYIVEIIDRRRAISRATDVSDEGTFRARGLDPGSYDVAVLTKSAWYGVRADVVVDGKEPTVRIDLPLQEGCTLALGRDSVTGEGTARFLFLESGAGLYVGQPSGVLSVPVGRSTLAVLGEVGVERRFDVQCSGAGGVANARLE